jgi:short-subunit dehydrogenase
MMRYRRILLRLGLLISPEKAAHFALKAMFRRKAKLIPGFLDRLVIIICPWVPDWLLSFLIRKTDLKSAF